MYINIFLLIDHFNRELLSQHPENLRTLMAHTVHNELSNSRNPNNMSLLGVMFNLVPELSAKVCILWFPYKQVLRGGGGGGGGGGRGVRSLVIIVLHLCHVEI